MFSDPSHFSWLIYKRIPKLTEVLWADILLPAATATVLEMSLQ